jgi:hypothetical protein
MNKNKLLLFASLAFVAAVSTNAALEDNGIASYTGSPTETNCTNCHSGTANSGVGTVTITHNIPATGYVPSTLYTINITVAQANKSLFGFGFEALTTATNANAGTLTLTNTATTRKITGTNGRVNVVHKKNGGAVANTKTFSFSWTAPATNVGSVKFWTAGMACNADGNDSGDLVYTANETIAINNVGIEELNSKIALKIYPNPAQQTLQITADLTGTHHLNICDIAGKTLTTQPITNQTTAINIETMPKGIYFVNIIDDKNKMVGSKRFVKN